MCCPRHVARVAVPEAGVTWRVTAAGLLEVAWLERVSHYAASHPARLDWEAAGRRGVAGGVAGGLRLANLQLGAQYTVTLTDLETNTTTAFNFTACKLLHFFLVVKYLEDQ